MTAFICSFPECTQVAVTRVTGNTVPAAGMVGVLIRPVAQGQGDLACLDHAHHAVDMLLLRVLDLTLGPPRTDEP